MLPKKKNKDDCLKMFLKDEFNFETEVQWKPLNVITFGQIPSNNISRMIKITGCFYIVSYNKWDFEM